MGIKLSAKHGLQPTIPLCPVCDEPKNEVALLGASGDKLAKALGSFDGSMPREAHIPGDLTPCDKCKAKGITIYTFGGTDNKELINISLVKEEAVRRIFKSSDKLSQILDTRVMFIDKELSVQIGLI